MDNSCEVFDKAVIIHITTEVRYRIIQEWGGGIKSSWNEKQNRKLCVPLPLYVFLVLLPMFVFGLTLFIIIIIKMHISYPK